VLRLAFISSRFGQQSPLPSFSRAMALLLRTLVNPQAQGLWRTRSLAAVPLLSRVPSWCSFPFFRQLWSRGPKFLIYVTRNVLFSSLVEPFGERPLDSDLGSRVLILSCCARTQTESPPQVVFLPPTVLLVSTLIFFPTTCERHPNPVTFLLLEPCLETFCFCR